MDPDELFAHAKELASQSEEKYWRTAASKAYYSVYHACLEFAKRLPKPPDPQPGKRSGSHERVARSFIEFPNAANPHHLKIRQIGYLFNEMRKVRVKADYTIDKEFREQDWREAERSAEKIHNLLREINE